jgi:hypothetical protein
MLFAGDVGMNLVGLGDPVGFENLSDGRASQDDRRHPSVSDGLWREAQRSARQFERWAVRRLYTVAPFAEHDPGA